MKIFQWLDLETISTCNRTCPTCLRNSHPSREAVKSWFEPHYMDEKVIEEALRQVQEMEFEGGVRLSHFNEPLMDERLPDLAWLVREYGYKPYINTDGDYITPDLAKRLDGAFHQIIVSLYMKEPLKSERAAWIPTLFKETEIQIITESDHIPSHFSPKFDVATLARQYVENTCREPAMRCIINHRGQFTLCCEDLIGNFDLGTFPETSIKDYWFGEKHTKIHDTLAEQGGRHWHSYCESCPKS
jgi:hypothetical protein